MNSVQCEKETISLYLMSSVQCEKETVSLYLHSSSVSTQSRNKKCEDNRICPGTRGGLY